MSCCLVCQNDMDVLSSARLCDDCQVVHDKHKTTQALLDERGKCAVCENTSMLGLDKEEDGRILGVLCKRCLDLVHDLDETHFWVLSYWERTRG